MPHSLAGAYRGLGSTERTGVVRFDRLTPGWLRAADRPHRRQQSFVDEGVECLPGCPDVGDAPRSINRTAGMVDDAIRWRSFSEDASHFVVLISRDSGKLQRRGYWHESLPSP